PARRVARAGKIHGAQERARRGDRGVISQAQTRRLERLRAPPHRVGAADHARLLIVVGRNSAAGAYCAAFVSRRNTAFGLLRPTASQPRNAALIAATSIFFMLIIASNARFALLPPAAIASVSTRGVICQEMPHLSLHQPHALSCPP